MILYSSNGKLLVKDGKLTTNQNCCCGCPDCTGPTCCSGNYPRFVGFCCENIWRMPGSGVCCSGVFYPTETSGNGECCDNVWHTDPGYCCNGVEWFEGAPQTLRFTFETEQCPSGMIFARWGEYGECCGCVDDEIWDPRPYSYYDPSGNYIVAQGGRYVPTSGVIDYVCCDKCESNLYLPFDEYGDYIGCKGTCCVEEIIAIPSGESYVYSHSNHCGRLFEYQCSRYQHPTHPCATSSQCFYSWTPGDTLNGKFCCEDNPCEVPCCVNGGAIEVATFTISGAIEGEWTLTFGTTVFTYTAQAGDTAYDIAHNLAGAVAPPFSAPEPSAPPPGGNQTIEVTGPNAGAGTITPPGGNPQPANPVPASNFGVFIVQGAVLVGEWKLILPWIFGDPVVFTYVAGQGETRENIAAGLAAAVAAEPFYNVTAIGATIRVNSPGASIGLIRAPNGETWPSIISGRTKLMSARECSQRGGVSTSSGDCGCKPGQTCCETATSSGERLTFNKPPQFSGTVRVTVTGTTTGPILVYDKMFGETATPSKRCPFTYTFLLCYGTFNIEPLPCGGTFHSVEVDVCYKEEATITEVFDYKGCNGPIALGACPAQCETTLLYTGTGLTSNAMISMYRDSTIEANGTGPLILGTYNETNIARYASCVNTLTLTGTSTAANEIKGSIGPYSEFLSSFQVLKKGTGTWWLTGRSWYRGGLSVLDGTLIVNYVPKPDDAGPLGRTWNGVSIRDPNATNGTATFLITESFWQIIRVQPGVGQVAVIGGYGLGSPKLEDWGLIYLGGDVTLQSQTGGTLVCSAYWGDLATNDYATFLPFNVTIGSEGNEGTVLFENWIPDLTSFHVRYGTVKLNYQDQFGGVIGPATPVIVGDTGTSVTVRIGNSITQPLFDITFKGLGSNITGPGGGILKLINSPTVTLNGTGHEISAAVVLDDDVTLDGTGSLLISGVVSGDHGVTMDGSGTVTLSGANTYTGTTTINSGTLKVTGSLSDATAVDVASGATYEAASTHAIGSIAGAGSVALGSSVTLTVGALNTSTTYSGTMSGAGNFVKVGTGTVTLSGDNTYTGTTTINAGTLKANSLTAFGTGDIVVNAGSTLDKNGYAITNNIINNGGTVIN